MHGGTAFAVDDVTDVVVDDDGENVVVVVSVGGKTVIKAPQQKQSAPNLANLRSQQFCLFVSSGR